MVVEFHLQMVSVLEGKLPLSLGKILLFWPNIMPFRNFVPTQTFGAPELDRQPGVEPDAHGELLLRWDDPVMMFQMKRSEDHFELEGFKKMEAGQLRLFGLK